MTCYKIAPFLVLLCLGLYLQPTQAKVNLSFDDGKFLLDFELKTVTIGGKTGPGIVFDITANVTGWVGIGFNEKSPTMGAADLFIGGVNASGNVYSGDYHGEKNSTQPQIDTRPNDWAVDSYSELNNKTKLTIRRLLNTGDTHDVEIQNKPFWLLWAYSETSDDPIHHKSSIFHHSKRGWLEINLVARASNMISISLDGGNYTLGYNITAPSITISLSVKTIGWVGLGLNANNVTMDGADYFMGGVNSTNGQVYSGDYHVPLNSGNGRPILDEKNISDWKVLSATEESGVTTLHISRLLNTTDKHDMAIQNKNFSLLWAYNTNNETAGQLPFHSRRGRVNVNLYNFTHPVVEEGNGGGGGGGGGGGDGGATSLKIGLYTFAFTLLVSLRH